MKKIGEYVLKNMANSNMFDVEDNTPLTPKQVYNIVINLSLLAKAASTRDLLELLVEDKIVETALQSDPNSIVAYYSASNAIMKLVNPHWNEFQWKQNTSFVDKKTGCTSSSPCVLGKSDKIFAISDFIQTQQRYLVPFCQTEILKKVDLTIKPEDSTQPIPVSTTIEDFENNLNILTNNYLIYFKYGSNDA